MAILSLEDAFLPPAKSSGSSGLLSLAEAFAKPEPINAEIDPAIYDLMSGTPSGLPTLPKKVGTVFERLTPEQLSQLPSAKPLPPPTSPERRAYDSATPEERNLLAKKFPKIKSLDEIYKEFDEQALAKKGPITDIIGEQYNFDTRLENRARALRAQGLDPEFAEGTAKMMAQQGYQGNQSPYGVAKAAGPEYDTEREFRISPDMGDLETAYMIAKRGITKAGVGIVQGGGGINRFLGDTLGLDTSSTQKTLEGLDRYTQSMGETTSNPARLFEAATTSIFQNLPAIAGSVVTGSTVPALASMFTSSFGQTYDQSRRNGLGYGDATARSTAFATLEVLGERLGLGTQLDIIKNALKKVPTRDLPDAISKTLTDYVKNTATREVPGELFTYTGQFATDKVFAQNEQAGFKDFIKGAMDTVAVTAIQGAVMGSGTAGAQKIINQFNRVTPDAVPTAKELLEQNGFSFEKKEPKEVKATLDSIPPTRIEPTLNLDNIPQRIEPTLREPTLQPTPESVVQPTPEIVREEPVSGNVATQPITPTKTLGYESESQDLESALAELRGEIVPTKVDKFDTPSIIEGLQTFEVPVADLSLSKDVPQFKSGASKEGVVEALGGKFDRTGVAPIQVWERLNGNLEIISGRHRFDLAKRSGEQTIPAQVHREADGFNVEQAASLDALLNIREGQGKVKDYVQFFQRPGYTREEAESSGVLARATGKRAFSIATNGVSDLVASHRADLISDEAATQIAETAPQDAALQNLGMKAVMDGKSITNSINLMQAVKSMTGDRESTGDLFGFDDSAMREAEQMADYASKIQRELGQRLSAITGAAKKPEIARAEGIDVKDEVAVRNRIDELRQAKAKWDRWSSFPELIGEIRAGLKLGVNKPIGGISTPKLLDERIGLPKGPARENGKNEEISFDDQILLKQMIVKTVEDGLNTGRTRGQIVQQLETLTKGGISNADMSRINEYLTEKNVQDAVEQVAPKEEPEIIASFPMGENTEFRVIQNDQGFIANLYDKDAEKYLDTSRVFPTKTFGEGAKDKAIKFAKEESEKAAKYNAPEEVKTQADINKERQAAKREVKEKFDLKDTKVVDENGNPLVVYHGTDKEDFSVFNPASWFSSSAKEATMYTRYGDLKNKERLLNKYKLSDDVSAVGQRVPVAPVLSDFDKLEEGKLYAEGGADGPVYKYLKNNKFEILKNVVVDLDSAKYDKNGDTTILLKKGLSQEALDTIEGIKNYADEFTGGEGGRIYPVYLSIKNPKYLDAMEANAFSERLGKSKEDIKKQIDKWKSEGYDGIITESDEATFFPEVKEAFGGIPKQYIPFDSSQIKTAIGVPKLKLPVKEKFDLKTTTPEELKKEEDVKAEKQKEKDRKTKEAESKVKKEVEKKEIADRSVGAAEDFKLGQTAEENLTGQKDIFGEDLFGGDQPVKKEPKLSNKEQARKDLLEDHFGVGNIIKSDYWGSYDRVLDFDWNNGAWSVSVMEVKEKDGKWVDAGRIRDHSTFPDKRDVIVQRGQNESIIDMDEDEGVPGSFVNNLIIDFVDKTINDFMVGDEVSFGSVRGVAVGIEGDYVKFRPFTSKNPKAYQRIQKKNLVFISRPDKGSSFSASKESTKYGSEAGELGMDKGKVLQLIGQGMYSANLVESSIKELLQNSFDAVKGAVSDFKQPSLYKVGNITVDINKDERTIKITDDARGMSLDIVKKAFFTVAGSDKSDLPPGESSGGFGIAKLGFMIGTERLKLNTVRDGVRIKVDATGGEIADNNFKIEKSPAPKSEHGTTVEIKIPKTYIDNGMEKPIHFWSRIKSINALNRTLIGPVEVKVNLTLNGNTDSVTLPIGVNFNEKETPFLTKVNFEWGTADVYFGVERKDDPTHEVLSSGVYQFNGKGGYSSNFNLNQSEIVPYDIVVNVKPKVEAKDLNYPFENNRESFKYRIQDDIADLEKYIASVARGEEAKNLKENFEGIVSMPRVEVGQDVAEISKRLKKVFDKRGAEQEQTETPPTPKEITIKDNVITDIRGEVLYDKKIEENKKESTFKADKDAPSSSQFMIEMKQDPKLPVFHNNTNVDFIEIGRQYGDPETFFAELGTLMVEMKEELGKSGMWGYEVLSPENLFFGGISIDKGYGGVHIKVPYKAVFFNPFYQWGAQSLFGVRQNFLNTMIHEVAHTGDMSHGQGHNGEMIRVEQYLADQGLLDYYRDAILDILSRHESTFTAMKDEYAKSTTQNTSKSLKDYEEKSTSARRDRGGSADQISALSARTGQGGSGAVPSGTGGNKASKVGGGSNKQPKTTGVSGSTIVISGRRNYAGGTPPLASWSAPTGSKLDSIIYTLQNKLIDTKRVQEEITKAGNDIEQDWDAYLKEELYHGRTAKQSMDFIDKELLPVIKELRKNGLTVEDFEEYLQNRHAEERNAQVAKVNPNLPDGGSGITNADARNYINQMLISNPAKLRALKSAASKIDSIITNTQDLLVSSGLEEQATIDKWRDTYKYYVPLNREDLDFSQKLTGTGSGFSTKGGSSKRAMGSTKGVVDIFANIAMQRERAIIRAEKSKVGRALYGLAITNPNPDFWLPVNPDAVKNKSKLIAELVSLGVDPADAANIIAEPKTPYIDPITGLVSYRVNPILRNSDNVFPIRVNGKDRYVFFNPNDPRALRMVSSLKNLDADQLGITLSAVAAATRWLASVNTQYNPVFGAWNFLRDTGAAQFNLSTTPIAGKQIQVNAGILPALHGIYSALRTGTPKGKWGNLWDEFQQQGGQTGFRNQFAKDREQRNIVERELNKINYGIPRKVANSVFQWLSDYNDSMENAVRLAAYKVGLDNGMTKERSASMAKNLTVNFNRKGQAGQVVGSLYAFFNASAQGTARLAQTLAGPAGRKIAAGGIMIGVIQALALSVRGFKEDEPEDYVKDKNIVIPFADGTYVMIPMPLGLHVFPAFGRIITEGVLAYRRTGNADAGKRGIQLLGVMADAFNPLGSGFSTLALSPTLADPIFALSGNKDTFGRPIAKEDRGTNPTPGYTRSRDTATSVSKWVSEFLNKASGGTKYQKGAISPTPDQLDFLAGQLTGGVGREIMKVEQVIESKFTGEKVPEYKKPIIGKIYGDTKSDPAISNKFYRNITKMAEFEHEIVGRAKNKEDVQAFIKEHPESVLWKGANNVENDISELNRMRREMRERKRPKEDIEKLDRKRYEIMQMFNNRVEELEEGRSRTAKR